MKKKKKKRFPWTARGANQSILKENSPEYSLEGLMLSWNSSTLATWCEGLTHWKWPWCWERLKVGEGDNRWWDGWMASPTWWAWVWVSSGSWWWTGKPVVLQSMGSQRIGWDWATELTNWYLCLYFCFAHRFICTISHSCYHSITGCLLAHNVWIILCNKSLHGFPCLIWGKTLANTPPGISPHPGLQVQRGIPLSLADFWSCGISL